VIQYYEKKFRNKLIVVCIGPVTNVAAATLTKVRTPPEKDPFNRRDAICEFIRKMIL